MTYRDDIGRERCSRCAKLTFRDEWSAGEAARIAVSRGTALRSYFERGCGYWHLTSQQQRAAAGWRLPPSRMSHSSSRAAAFHPPYRTPPGGAALPLRQEPPVPRHNRPRQPLSRLDHL